MSPWFQIQSLMVVVSKRLLLKSCYFLALSIIRQRKGINSKGKRKQRFWFRSIFQLGEELGASRFENSLGTCWDSFLFLLKSTIRPFVDFLTSPHPTGFYKTFVQFGSSNSVSSIHVYSTTYL